MRCLKRDATTAKALLFVPVPIPALLSWHAGRCLLRRCLPRRYTSMRKENVREQDKWREQSMRNRKSFYCATACHPALYPVLIKLLSFLSPFSPLLSISSSNHLASSLFISYHTTYVYLDPSHSSPLPRRLDEANCLGTTAALYTNIHIPSDLDTVQ